MNGAHYKGAHFATFPPDLVQRPLLATCPEVICTACRTPWRRQVTVTRTASCRNTVKQTTDHRVLQFPVRYEVVREVGDLIPCGCQAPTTPGVVLDPFFGSGTVAEVAIRNRRDWIGIELNPHYATLARRRIATATHIITDELTA